MPPPMETSPPAARDECVARDRIGQVQRAACTEVVGAELVRDGVAVVMHSAGRDGQDEDQHARDLGDPSPCALPSCPSRAAGWPARTATDVATSLGQGRWVRNRAPCTPGHVQRTPRRAGPARGRRN